MDVSTRLGEVTSHFSFRRKDTDSYCESVPINTEIVESAIPLMLSALENTQLKGSTSLPFTIVEFGCADGGASLNLIKQAIAFVKRKYGCTQEIQLVYNDQAENDFEALENNVKEITGVTKTSIMRDFYARCMEASSINFGLCFTSLHWLQERPSLLTSCLFHMFTDDTQEQIAYRDAAAKDWKCFLDSRSKELISGGYLLISVPGSYSPEDNVSNADYWFKHFYIIWHSLYIDGIIHEDEMKQGSFNFYLRNEEELRAPFKNPLNGLRLVSLTAQNHEKAVGQAFNEHQDYDAALFVSSIRVWSNSTFLGALRQSRPIANKEIIVNELFKRFEEYISSSTIKQTILIRAYNVLIRKA